MERNFYYERRDDISHRTIIEIDFLTIIDRKISPIEVKSSDTFKTKSLNKFKDTFKEKVNNGIVLYDGDIKIVDSTLYLPLFMAEYL